MHEISTFFGDNTWELKSTPKIRNTHVFKIIPSLLIYFDIIPIKRFIELNKWSLKILTVKEGIFT